MICHPRATRGSGFSIFQGLRTADTTSSRLQWGLQTGPRLCNFGCMPGEWRNRFYSMHEGYTTAEKSARIKKYTRRRGRQRTTAPANTRTQTHSSPDQTRNRVKIAALENIITSKIIFRRETYALKSTIRPPRVSLVVTS